MPKERRRVNNDPLHRVVITGVNRGNVGVSAFQEVLGTKEGGSRSCRQDSMHALR
jgi:hypothetical protein